MRGWNLNHSPPAAAESPVRPKRQTVHGGELMQLYIDLDLVTCICQYDTIRNTKVVTWMFICLSCSILCSSNKPPFNVRNLLVNSSASSLISVRPSSRRFSLCMDSSDNASTFSSISNSMFCSSRRREAISNMVPYCRH